MEARPPKEILNNPELLLVWSGLKISIETEQITRRQAYEMVMGKPIPLIEQSFGDWWIHTGQEEVPRFGYEDLGQSARAIRTYSVCSTTRFPLINIGHVWVTPTARNAHWRINWSSYHWS